MGAMTLDGRGKASHLSHLPYSPYLPHPLSGIIFNTRAMGRGRCGDISAGIIFNTRADVAEVVGGGKKIGASREGSSDLLSGPKTYDVIRMEEHHCKHRYTCYRPRVSSQQ